ncbi:MAG: hypothetical protein ABIJ26_06035, partial [Candidatus Margulisiibacteriota bacterium]
DDLQKLINQRREEAAEQEITLQKYREDRQRRDGKIAAQRDTISALKEHIKSLKRNVPSFVEDGINEIPIVFNDTSMKAGGAE